MIPYGKQDIDEDDIQAVLGVLKADLITQGPVATNFEQAVANYCGATYSVAVNSGTSALHIACLALGLGKGDRLWTTPNTFVASANCALYCGAQVDFVDIDSTSYNISIDKLEEKLIEAQTLGTLPKVIVAVHFSGQSCEMKTLKTFSQHYGFSIIEDASHALGGRYCGAPIGSCSYSDITIFSFHPVKPITSGEGGMAVTNNSDLASTMQRLRSHGITRDPKEMQSEPDGPWAYEQIELGFNYRLTDIQAALGLSQFKKLDKFVSIRNDLCERYDNALHELPLKLPKQSSEVLSARHIYVICLRLEKIPYTKRDVFENLRQAGIGVNFHYIPVHTQPYYRNLGFKVGDYPVAEQYAKEAITLPLYPTLSHSEQDKIIQTLHDLLG